MPTGVSAKELAIQTAEQNIALAEQEWAESNAVFAAAVTDAAKVRQAALAPLNATFNAASAPIWAVYYAAKAGETANLDKARERYEEKVKRERAVIEANRGV